MFNIQNILLFLLISLSGSVYAGNIPTTLSFACERAEKNYIERYEMKVTSASPPQKAKVWMDDRDLDQSDTHTRQLVKSVVITESTVLVSTEAYFAPEELGGVQYQAGTVMTMTMIDLKTGKLKKVETIQGGILSEKLGNGTRFYEEQCALLKPGSVIQQAQ